MESVRGRLAVRDLVDGVPAGTTLLIHDGADRVLAELDGSGAPLREYVWLNGMPVAVLDATQDPSAPVLLFVHADHLDRPAVMSDREGREVWQATYDPFGAVRAITGPASLDLRFPGQWFQLETGLAYNWHRHYDATTGRYTAPDPLGLHEEPQPSAVTLDGTQASFQVWLEGLSSNAGPVDHGIRVRRDGRSLYAYVDANPVQKIDPKGLLSRGPMSQRKDRFSKNVEQLCAANDNNWEPNTCKLWGTGPGNLPGQTRCSYMCDNGTIISAETPWANGFCPYTILHP